jgi:hypothetical protein
MISPEVLKRASEFQKSFQGAHPFRHIAIDGFLKPEACESLLRDFPAFDPSKAINEMGEVGRKAVFEDVAAISPFYRQFYQYINSQEFLDAISALTGVPELIADPDLYGGGTHENLDGQYLDVHVDFNIDEGRMLHRRLNVLVYLNKEWEDTWGGLVELHSNPRKPEVNEVKSFAPLFNRAVIFETNEHSWHGFETVCLPEDRKHLSRKSFSIYLYTKDRPAEEAVASHTTFYLSRPLPNDIQAGKTLTEEDVQNLRKLLNSRDGLLEMYQKLLIEKEQRLLEKEQRLRNVMRIRQEMPVSADMPSYDVILASRSWRVVMALHRIKNRIVSSIRHLGLRR